MEVQDLTVRKNLRAKKGKQNWKKNIDVSVLQKAIEQQNKEKWDRMVQKSSQKKKIFGEDLIFDLDLGKGYLQQKKQKLQQDRFVKKPVLVKSLLEGRKIEKMAEKEKQKDERQLQEERKREEDVKKILEYHPREVVSEDSEENFDAWEDGVQKSFRERMPIKFQKLQKQYKQKDIARVVVPSEGISYNPSFKAHQSLVDEIVKGSEYVKEKIQKTTRGKKIEKFQTKYQKLIQMRKINNKPKTLRGILQQQIIDKQLKEKKLNHEFTLLKKFHKEIDQEKQENEIKQIVSQNRKENERIRNLQGIVTKPLKINKNKYKMKPQDIQNEDQLAENLRQLEVNPSTLIRETFDSFYRRGQLEIREVKKKRRIAVPKFKLKNKFGANLPDEFDKIAKEFETQ